MILQELSEAFGVSGAEDAVRRLVLEHIKPHAESIKIDSMGNILAVRKGAGASDLRVMVTAHMDEIGFMVTGHDSSGMLMFTTVGGVPELIMPGQRVVVGKKKQVPGVINIEPIHLASGTRRVKSIESLRIDIGVDSKKAAESKAPVGSYVAFDTPFVPLGERTVRGKAFDDRAGCAVLTELFTTGEPFPFDLLAAYTVQEEVGLRGARVAAFALEPDLAFVFEGTVCNDLPQEPEDDLPTVTRLGDGPAISVMDRTMIADRRLVDYLVETAEAKDIPYQIKTPGAGGTDAGRIHISRAGVPSAVISVPCRYIHSPASILNLDDLTHAVGLMRAALMQLTPEVLQR